jgi:peptidyl-prolyl cis-trans isomerase B (cyclophilin B)
VVTKKRRRAQLTRASRLRQQARRAQRERRRRKIRLLTTAVLVVLVVAGLMVWIVLHEADSGSTGAGPVDYPSGAAHAAHLPQTSATTTEGAR